MLGAFGCTFSDFFVAHVLASRIFEGGTFGRGLKVEIFGT